MNHIPRTNPFPIIIRTTAILLYFKLIVLELTFFVVYLLVLLFLTAFMRTVGGPIGIETLIISYAALGLLKSIFLFLAIMLWIHDYYELFPDIVIHKTGIFQRHTVSFRLFNISVQAIDQSFIGRVFHYGSIELQNQFLQERFHVIDIPKPQKYIKLIKECMSDGALLPGTTARKLTI